MSTTTIDEVRGMRVPAKATRRDTPIWGLPLPTASRPTPVTDEDLLPGEALPTVRGRPSAHTARMLHVVQAAVASGEATRGRPPPFTVAFIVAAQWVFFAAAVLNLVVW